MTIAIEKMSTKPSRHTRQSIDLETLVDEHWESLCRVAYHFLGDWDESQDVVIETFTRFVETPPPLKTNIPGWLYRVTTNRALNLLRSNSRRMEYEKQLETPGTGVHSMIPEDAVVSSEQKQAVRAALRRISPRAANLLVLRYSGLSYKEIAEAVNVAPGSVGTLLARAEKEFMSQFEKTQPEPAGG